MANKDKKQKNFKKFLPKKILLPNNIKAKIIFTIVGFI